MYDKDFHIFSLKSDTGEAKYNFLVLWCDFCALLPIDPRRKTYISCVRRCGAPLHLDNSIFKDLNFVLAGENIKLIKRYLHFLLLVL